MKYWAGILFSIIHVSVSAQEYRDVKSWFNDVTMNSELKLSDDLREYDYVYKTLIPSSTLKGRYKLTLKTEPFQYEVSDKFINMLRWSKTFYLRPGNINSGWKPTNKLFIEGGNYRYNTVFCPENFIGMNLKAGYKLTNKLSINIYGCYIANDYKNPTPVLSTLYRSEVGANLSYNITKNLKIKTGMQYQYNILSGHWEHMYLTGIAFSF